MAIRQVPSLLCLRPHRERKGAFYCSRLWEVWSAMEWIHWPPGVGGGGSNIVEGAGSVSSASCALSNPRPGELGANVCSQWPQIPVSYLHGFYLPFHLGGIILHCLSWHSGTTLWAEEQLKSSSGRDSFQCRRSREIHWGRRLWDGHWEWIGFQ